jgi:glycosyltransferase involved in cell wall biosynthesis
MAGLGSKARFIPAQPQNALPGFYSEGDLFMLPTIEDGFPFVLAQASAACLPILTTPNGAGADLVQEQKNGWVLPARSPVAFIERLRWCDAHRKELVELVRWMHNAFVPRGWEAVAADFEKLCSPGR